MGCLIMNGTLLLHIFSENTYSCLYITYYLHQASREIHFLFCVELRIVLFPFSDEIIF